MFRCEKRNNEIYITFSDYDFFNPIIFTNFTEQIPVKLKKSEKWHNGRIIKK